MARRIAKDKNLGADPENRIVKVGYEQLAALVRWQAIQIEPGLILIPAADFPTDLQLPPRRVSTV